LFLRDLWEKACDKLTIALKEESGRKNDNVASIITAKFQVNEKKGQGAVRGPGKTLGGRKGKVAMLVNVRGQT